MTGKYTLGKEERLKSRKAIDELFGKGQRLNAGPLRAVYMKIAAPEFRLGVGVSSRLFKRAVDRNRVKRLLREAFRLNKLPLKEALQRNNSGMNIFLSYAGSDLPSFIIVEEATKTILGKLLKKVNENISSHT